MNNLSKTKASVQIHAYKHVNLLLVLYITFLLLVVSLANRFLMLGGMLQAGGIFVFPLTFLICDAISEVYGYSLARKFIWLGAFCELIFALTATAIVHLPYPTEWQHYSAYKVVFDPTIRYVLSGLVALLVGEFINVYILVKWKIRLQGRLFWLRSIIAAACGQAALTIIVDICAFLGVMSLESLVWMMYSGFAWKMAFAILLAYPTWIVIKFLKKSEGVDIYDLNISFNPFKR